MKPLKRKLASSLAVFVLLSVTQVASAFYDPSLGRWLNRDPVEEIAFQNQTATHRSADYFNGNLYWYVANNPPNKLDSWGLQITFSGCKQEEEDAIKKAISDNCDKARVCAGCPIGSAGLGVNALCGANPNMTIACRDTSFVSGTESCADNCGLTQVGTKTINICPGAFNPDRCPHLGCTVFHEGLHTEGLRHGHEMTNFDKCMDCQ